MPAAIYPSPLGPLHVHCSGEHITAVIFKAEPLAEENNYPPLLQTCILQLDEYFSGKRKTFDLPLAQPGTPFQQKVWDLLYQIPYGKTMSYQQLATQYGDLKAIRAVASANGKNNLAIIIPCHRVIGSNRSLTGYAGGLWRKKWLLEHEAKHHSGVAQLGLLLG
ncbi:MAG TPA: methylated-DNA--[protein]-cysteine S-methyltransferase [Flavisolibacter sp.]